MRFAWIALPILLLGMQVDTAEADRFEVDDQGVILDTVTGNHWFCLSANGRVDVEGAESRIRALNRQREPAGDNWRLPTLQELEELYYDAGISYDETRPFQLPSIGGSRPSQVICSDGDDFIKFGFKNGSAYGVSYRIYGGDVLAVWAVR